MDYKELILAVLKRVSSTKFVGESAYPSMEEDSNLTDGVISKVNKIAQSEDYHLEVDVFANDKRVIKKFVFANNPPVVPEKGMHARLYLENHYGMMSCRGLFLDGQKIYYNPPIPEPQDNEFPENDDCWAEHTLTHVSVSQENDPDDPSLSVFKFIEMKFITSPIGGEAVLCSCNAENCGGTPPFIPEAGDRVRFYSKGTGYSVRGVFVNGKKFYYRTEEEEKAKFEEWKAKEEKSKHNEWMNCKDSLMEKVRSLPQPFQKRIQRFFDGIGVDKFGANFLSYELFACEQSLVIAKAVDSELPDGYTKDECHVAFEKFRKLPYEEQILKGVDENHSGNTFDFSCMLAEAYLTNPDIVEKMHGAMVPLVGCEAYGCTH